MKHRAAIAQPAPPEASVIFVDRVGLAIQYADLLAGEASVRGLIGPAELPRLWTRHLLNCAVLGELIPPSVEVLDIGSGAGLPGIPLAIARPDLTVTLVEPLLRRSGWLDEVVPRLGLAGVTVLRARAEELHGQRTSQVVTARAVAPLDRLARWCLPLVRPGGELLAMKGQAAEQELLAATDTLRRLGAVEWEVLTLGAGKLPDTTSVVRVKVGTNRPPPPPAQGASRQPQQQPGAQGQQRRAQRQPRGRGGAK